MKAIAAGDGHRVHPHGHHDREVERGDTGHDPERLSHRRCVHPAGDVLGELTFEKMGDPAGELHHLDAAGDLTACVFCDLAVFGGDQAGQVVAVPVGQLTEGEENAGSRPSSDASRQPDQAARAAATTSPTSAGEARVTTAGLLPGRRDRTPERSWPRLPRPRIRSASRASSPDRTVSSPSVVRTVPSPEATWQNRPMSEPIPTGRRGPGRGRGAATERTRLRRLPEQGSHRRTDLCAVLDAGFVCHLGLLLDGWPMVVPTSYARQDNWLFLHGSVASRSLRAAREPVGRA